MQSPPLSNRNLITLEERSDCLANLKTHAMRTMIQVSPTHTMRWPSTPSRAKLGHSNDSGSGRPARNALKSPSDRSGCEKGASCDAPRTVAKDSAPPPNTCVPPPTCFPWNHARYGAVVFSRSLPASRRTSVRLPVSGITESWSPLQCTVQRRKKEQSLQSQVSYFLHSLN
uniref:Uncharacterized protein n=1 Tax=Arundo donax TaxID=35708 RepID=A0A0A9DA17_ARUDO